MALDGVEQREFFEDDVDRPDVGVVSDAVETELHALALQGIVDSRYGFYLLTIKGRNLLEQKREEWQCTR